MNSDLSRIHGERVIGVNNSAFLGDWVDVCWFGDLKWWNWNKERIRSFKGLVATCNMKMVKWSRMKVLQRGKPQGIEPRPTHVSWNRNSGASAINLAYHLGASRIVLLGFDMQMVGGRKNWHDEHHEKPHNPFARHLRPFPVIARDAVKLGIEIINATPGSAIRDLPIMTLEDVLDGKPIPKVQASEEPRAAKSRTKASQRRTKAARRLPDPDESIVRKTTTMEDPKTIGAGVFIGHFNVFRSNVTIGDNTKIGHHCVFEGDITIGADCLIQPQCNITAGTVIEDKVFIGQGVITGNDKRMVHLRRDKVPFNREAPYIEYGARIGMGSLILPGVRVGRESFIAAGSVVTADTEPFCFYKGSPARKVSRIPDSELLDERTDAQEVGKKSEGGA